MELIGYLVVAGAVAFVAGFTWLIWQLIKE